MDAHRDDAAVSWLMTPAAVRQRANLLFGLAEADELPHFTYHPDRLQPAVDYVLDTIRANYPSLDVPFHSRWRHFSAGGVDRWGKLSAELGAADPAEIARIRIDLAVVSVLLDAGAGPAWQYQDDGAAYARSEGLAVASFKMFAAGLFSADPFEPFRADAERLIKLTDERLARGFQVDTGNPLVGLSGRTDLLRRLGAALRRKPELFGVGGRIGTLFDYLRGQAKEGALPATAIFAAVMRGFGEIWPGRNSLAGVNLGDTWRHSWASAGDATDGFVPFHKLSQWLTYSLIEPLEDAGLKVVDIDGLTGLPEYRNGGLLLDLGVIAPRDADLHRRVLSVDDEAVVEWRALTVALLDRIADGVRQRLGRSADDFPLAKVLEGGTWAAGRRIAREKRPDGGPPLKIESDGTVF